MFNQRLKREFEHEKVKVKERDKLIKKQSEANEELRTENEELHEILHRVKEEIKRYHFGSEEDLKNKIKSILADNQSN